MKIGKRLYYDNQTGEIILDTGQREGDVVQTTVERDIEAYTALSERNRDTFDVMELAFGEFAADFAICNGYKVNTKTQTLEFSYPDPNNPDAEITYQVPITVEIERLKAAFMTAEQRYQAINLADVDLETLRAAKIEQLKEACTAAIYGGFTSAALDKDFGFNEMDQANFAQQFLLVVSGDNAGADISWKTKQGIVKMTESQFRAVIQETKDHKMAQQKKYWQLEAYVLAAETVADVDNIHW